MVTRHFYVDSPDTEALKLIFFCLKFKVPNGSASWHSNNHSFQSKWSAHGCKHVQVQPALLRTPATRGAKVNMWFLTEKNKSLKPSSTQRALFNCWRVEWVQALGVLFILWNSTGVCLYFHFLCQSCEADGFQTIEIVHGRCLMKIPDWNMILTKEKEKNLPNTYFSSCGRKARERDCFA